MAYADVLAIELHQQIQRHGWTMVAALRTLRLTENEAEALFMRLDWLKQELPGMLQAFAGLAQQTAQPSAVFPSNGEPMEQGKE